MKNVRAGETRHHPFRSERMFYSNNAWFFLLRGGSSKGPFSDRATAQRQLDRYITTQQELYRALLEAGKR